jgi:hypothetical protein
MLFFDEDTKITLGDGKEYFSRYRAYYLYVRLVDCFTSSLVL